MKVGVIGAEPWTGYCKAFAQVEGYEVALCDIKQNGLTAEKPKSRKVMQDL